MSTPEAAVRYHRARKILGAPVTDGHGRKLATVRDFGLDDSGLVRYLEVDLGMFRKHVLVPAHAVDWGVDAVVLREWTEETLRQLPPIDDGAPLTAALEEELRRAFPRFYDPESVADAEAAEPRPVPLKEAKQFRLAEGTPDVRGWTVFGADGERAGTVADLLVDPVALRIRYLVVDLADDLFALRDDRHVLVPTEAVELRERGRDVWVRTHTARELATLPAYLGGAVDPLVQRRVDEAFAGRAAGAVPDVAAAPTPSPEAVQGPATSEEESAAS